MPAYQKIDEEKITDIRTAVELFFNPRESPESLLTRVAKVCGVGLTSAKKYGAETVRKLREAPQASPNVLQRAQSNCFICPEGSETKEKGVLTTSLLQMHNGEFREYQMPDISSILDENNLLELKEIGAGGKR